MLESGQDYELFVFDHFFAPLPKDKKGANAARVDPSSRGQIIDRTSAVCLLFLAMTYAW